jgi:hypothetical protein
MKYRTVWEPNVFRYRAPRRKLTPEDEEILRRRLARAKELRRTKFPEFYKD